VGSVTDHQWYAVTAAAHYPHIHIPCN